MTLAEIDKALAEAHEKACELQALADAESRHLTEDEQADLENALAEFDKLQEQRALRAKVEANTKRLKGEPDDDDKQSNRVIRQDAFTPSDDSRASRMPVRVTERWRNDPKWGCRMLGEFAQAIIQSRNNVSAMPQHIQRALSTYGSEGVGADGGFAVPPDFVTAIDKKLTSESDLFPLCRKIPCSSNSLTITKSEVTPWGTSGPQEYVVGEATTITQSKPSLERHTIPVHKIGALIPLTDELIEDAPALEAVVMQEMAEQIAFRIDLMIYQGTGAGEMLGVVNATGTVSVAKESGQTADTIVGANVQNMWNRLFARWRNEAVWVVNQDCEVQLQNMIITPGSLTDFAVYLPTGGFSQAPFNTLMGRRVIFSQVCETLGDKGDILLGNFDHYIIAQRGGVRTAQSIHFWFDQATTALRTTVRIGGQPRWSSVISARDGSATYSAFVTLDERA